MTPPEGAGIGVGADAHYRALESLYAAAPINRFFDSRLEIRGGGEARIHFTVDERHFHAGGAAHGTSYFKMLDDAAFYACNSLVTDRFLLTTAFNLLFTRPLGPGPVIAVGRWFSNFADAFGDIFGDIFGGGGRGRSNVYRGADLRYNLEVSLEEAARGTGTFMKSRIALAGLPGYRAS